VSFQPTTAWYASIGFTMSLNHQDGQTITWKRNFRDWSQFINHQITSLYNRMFSSPLDFKILSDSQIIKKGKINNCKNDSHLRLLYNMKNYNRLVQLHILKYPSLTGITHNPNNKKRQVMSSRLLFINTNTKNKSELQFYCSSNQGIA
jgi:hypothetical protein